MSGGGGCENCVLGTVTGFAVLLKFKAEATLLLG